MVLEQLIDEMGPCNWFQTLITLLLMAPKIPIAFSLMLPSFSTITPDWWCVSDRSEVNDSLHNKSHHFCSFNDTTCSRMYSEDKVTVVSEWDLVCSKKWINKIIVSIQMSGLLVALIVAGQMAELLGRKKVVYLSFAGHAIFNLICVFSVSWEMYAVFRFLIGGTCGAALMSNTVLGMEFLGSKWRPLLVTIPFWELGICLFALIAWLFPNWSHLHVISAVAMLPFLAGWFIVPESMRWLTVKGRLEEAELVVDQIAKYNGKHKPADTAERLKWVAEEEKSNPERKKKYSYIDVFRGWKMIKLTSPLCFIWFCCSAVYYGITYNVQKMSGNLYVNIVLLSLVEIPGDLPIFFLVRTLGRKWTLFGGILLTGLSGVGTLAATATANEDIKHIVLNVLALVAKFGLGGSWNVLQVLTIELYPTVVRGAGFAATQAFARVGGIVAPLILLVDTNIIEPYAIMGSLMLVSALCVLTLTETKNRPAEDILFLGRRDDGQQAFDEIKAVNSEDNEEDIQEDNDPLAVVPINA